MVENLHKKLTIIFSTCFALIMFVTIITIYLLFRSSFYDVAKQEVQDVLLTEQYEFLEDPQYITKYHLSGEYLFYFLYPDHHLISNSHKKNLKLERELKKLKEIPTPTIITISNSSDETSYAVSGKVLIKNGKKLGQILVVKNISRIQEQIERWFYILSCILFVLSLVSIYVGNLLAKRAILPIKANMEKQRKFTADASHELRTPISVMLSSVEILEEQEELSPFSMEIVRDLKEEVKETHQLIETLLLLTKYESHQINFQNEPFDIQAQLETICRNFKKIAGSRTIQFHKTSEQILVLADKIQIKRLVSIFLENAIKYTEANGDIQIHVTQEEKNIILQITDNGIGISAEHIPHIFDRMYQVDKSRSQLGAGFGLAIARQIIDYYKGGSQVKSSLESGTTFIISLPIICS